MKEYTRSSQIKFFGGHYILDKGRVVGTVSGMEEANDWMEENAIIPSSVKVELNNDDDDGLEMLVTIIYTTTFEYDHEKDEYVEIYQPENRWTNEQDV